MANILLRLGEEDSQLLEKKAKASGLSNSEFLRMCLRKVKGFEVVMEGRLKPIGVPETVGDNLQVDKPLLRPRKSVQELQELVDKVVEKDVPDHKHWYNRYGVCADCGAKRR